MKCHKHNQILTEGRNYGSSIEFPPLAKLNNVHIIIIFILDIPRIIHNFAET